MTRRLPYLLIVFAILALPLSREGATKRPCKGAELRMISDDDAFHNGQALTVMTSGKRRLTIRLESFTDKEIRYRLSLEPDSTISEKPIEGRLGEVLLKDDAYTIFKEASTKTEFSFAFAIVAKDKTRVEVYCQREFVQHSRLEKGDKGVYYIRTISDATRQQLRYYGTNAAVKFGECIIRVFEGDCLYRFHASLPWPDLAF